MSNLKGTIVAPKQLRVLYALAPIIICFAQYVVISVSFIYGLTKGIFPIELKALAYLYLVISFVMLMFWYRTLFDKEYLGADRIISVQWDNDLINLQGVYFEITVSLDDVERIFVKHAAITENVFVVLYIKMRTGKKQKIPIGTVVCNTDLIGFLESKGKKCKWKD